METNPFSHHFIIQTLNPSPAYHDCQQSEGRKQNAFENTVIKKEEKAGNQ